MKSRIQVQVLNEAVCVNAIKQSIHPITLSKVVWQIGFFYFGKTTSLTEGKLWIQTSSIPLKRLSWYHILPVADGLGKCMQK